MPKERSRREMLTLRHARLRKKVIGTADRPRLSVFRSGRHIYAQVIDDQCGKTIAAANTVQKELKDSAQGVKPMEAAKLVGTAIAERAKAAGVERVVFDRGGFKYHGRVKALADAARAAGLEL